ncbi:MAG: undecaprenyl-phosphate glucose phosphotransferase [Flavisolibacter sp.]
MNRTFPQLMRFTFAVLDLLALNLLFIVTRYYYSSTIPGSLDLNYIYLLFFCNLFWVGSCWLRSTYQGQNISSFEIFSRKSMQTYLNFLILLTLYLYFNKQYTISRLFISSFLVLFSLGLFLNRTVYFLLFRFLLKKDYLIKRIMILGYNEISKKLVTYLEGDTIKSEIIGFCEDEKNVKELSHYPIIHDVNDIIEISKKNRVTDIYSTISPEQNRGIYQLMHEADQACIRFKLVADLSYFIRKPVHIDYFGEIPVLSLRNEPLDDVANRVRKRLVDLLISSLVIVFILSWLIPVISILIWIESRGPVFFIQKRTGKDNKPFSCIKFRSMRPSGDADERQATKMDDRTTSIGRFLRRTNLDEFPQFLNVFMSDMSIVGPRPHMLKHTDDYSKLLNQYMVRQFLKPGITGWAQIHGFRGETRSLSDMSFRVEHDLWYMENWNLLLDLKIIFLTAFNMLRGEKNAF